MRQTPQPLGSISDTACTADTFFPCAAAGAAAATDAYRCCCGRHCVPQLLMATSTSASSLTESSEQQSRDTCLQCLQCFPAIPAALVCALPPLPPPLPHSATTHHQARPHTIVHPLPPPPHHAPSPGIGLRRVRSPRSAPPSCWPRLGCCRCRHGHPASPPSRQPPPGMQPRDVCGVQPEQEATPRRGLSASGGRAAAVRGGVAPVVTLTVP